VWRASTRDFLLGTLVPIGWRLNPSEIAPSPWAGSALATGPLRRKLRRVLAAPGEPPTFAAIARELKIDRKSLREREPDLAEEAVRLREAWVAARTTQRRERAVASVIAITRGLHASGITPSRRRVEARLEAPFTLQEDALKEAWRETVRQLHLVA
jgi:hypothetical protein